MASHLRDELVRNNDDTNKELEVLREKGLSLFRSHSDGSAFVQLMEQLGSWPYVALEVFYWRRRQAECDIPMTLGEYAKGISVAGRFKNVDLAVELFAEAPNKCLKTTTTTYNALMDAYMCSDLADKHQSLFQDLKGEENSSPSIVTCNILISGFGRLLMVNLMEVAFQEIKDSNLSPHVYTYNSLIAGYLTACM